MHTTLLAIASTLEGAGVHVKALPSRLLVDRDRRPPPSLPSEGRHAGRPGRNLTMIRLHRHRLGPRVYVLGRRIHEWHLGAVLVAGVLAGIVTDVWEPSP